jgi:hypothetical protein
MTSLPKVVFAPTGWLDRYRRGQGARVWAEMTGIGADIRRTEWWPEARAVAAETMVRARANVERLLVGLPALGFEFENPMPKVLDPPSRTIVAELDELERVTGSLPLSLRAWYEHVGNVNLAGANPAWQYELTDPLVVDAPLDYVRSEFDDWLSSRSTPWARPTFRIPIAPDALHKANISGGSPYEIDVPTEAADGLLLWEPGQTTFVSYLRHAFQWAGLPGWDPASERYHSYAPGPVPPGIPQLAAELMAI